MIDVGIEHRFWGWNWFVGKINEIFQKTKEALLVVLAKNGKVLDGVDIFLFTGLIASELNDQQLNELQVF